MFSKIMLVLKLLRSRLHLRIDQFTAGRHFRDFLCNDRIVHCLMGVLAPGKHAMIFTQHSRNRLVVPLILLIVIRDQDARVRFIRLVDLLFRQISDTGDRAVEIVVP